VRRALTGGLGESAKSFDGETGGLGDGGKVREPLRGRGGDLERGRNGENPEGGGTDLLKQPVIRVVDHVY
jgi:hypothetical protein